MVPLINSKRICRRKPADMCNTIFEKCSRRVQRELKINIDVFRNRVNRFKSTLLSAFAKEVKDAANSMPLTVKYVIQSLSENVEDENNNIIEALKLWCDSLHKNTGEQKQLASYIDVTGQLSPPITLNVYSFLSEIEGHPTYTGFKFNYYSFGNCNVLIAIYLGLLIISMNAREIISFYSKLVNNYMYVYM